MLNKLTVDGSYESYKSTTNFYCATHGLILCRQQAKEKKIHLDEVITFEFNSL